MESRPLPLHGSNFCPFVLALLKHLEGRRMFNLPNLGNKGLKELLRPFLLSQPVI